MDNNLKKHGLIMKEPLAVAFKQNGKESHCELHGYPVSYSPKNKRQDRSTIHAEGRCQRLGGAGYVRQSELKPLQFYVSNS